MPDLNDTIVALASAAGPGARAIIRLSGQITHRILRSLMPELNVDPTQPRQWASGAMVTPEIHSPLPAEIYLWRGPRSYTGQDLAEIHTVSAPALVQIVVARCLAEGARAAQPGEFTMRAFLAGKVDLTRAEAIAAVVEASTSDQLQEALKQLAGGLAQPLHTVRDDLLNLLADVEAGLDFADEDIQFVGRTDLLQRVTRALAHVTLVRKQLEQRALGHLPFRVVLAGPPNAGKSRLFNALVGEDRAIVSAAQGTTRDWLEAALTIGEVRLRLVDTAGQRSTDDLIEKAAQTLGRDAIANADLIVWCRAPDDTTAPALTGPNVLPVATKCDLGVPWPALLAVSALTGAGLDELRQELGRRARAHGGNPLTASLSRCRHHVDACLAQLRRAHHLVLEEQPPELLALELRTALDELGAMVGAIYTDDLLDRIFSRFCIGK